MTRIEAMNCDEPMVKTKEDATAFFTEYADYCRGKDQKEFTAKTADILMACIFAIEALEKQSSADVVEVIRCKDCVYWEQATDNSGNCNRAFEITAYGSDFCSYGERREDEH